VPRPRLIERLDAVLHRKLTLISAPAGFGKTTLVSEWADHLRSERRGGVVPPAGATTAPLQIAWLSLDEGDNDLTRFLTYLIAALQTIEPNFGTGGLSALQSPQPPPTEVVLTALINELTAHSTSAQIVLVLDDYHLIEAQPVHDALTFLLRRLPPPSAGGLHTVIATREDPPLPLARLRARGQLTELRATDLRFTPSEAADFLTHVMGLDLSADGIAALEARTEGWVAGLQLAAISMQGRKDTTGFIRSFTGSHRFVLDYLLEEVLEQQPESVQAFLQQTAVLGRLTGPLCDALTGQQDGRFTLERLDRANLFIVPLDEERRWYRYHHLFADLLRQRLRQTQPEQVPRLHTRAIEWYEKNGLTGEAIEHALRAQAFERAAELIESVADAMWGREQHHRLRPWLAKLPPENLSARPHLCVFHAGYLFVTGQQDAAERHLQAAEQAVAELAATEQATTEQVDRAKLLGRIATNRASMASYRSDAPGVIPHALQALEYLPKQDVTWRGIAAIALGDAYIYQGQYAQAHQTYLEALEALRATDNTYLLMNVSLKLALNLRAQGRLQQAIELCQQRLQLAQESGMSHTEMVGWLLAIWGEVLAEVGDLDGALEQVQKGVELTVQGSDVAMLTWSYLCLTRVLFSRGELAAAQELITETERVARSSTVPPWVTKMMASWQVRVWLVQEGLSHALEWVRKRGLDPGARPSYVGALEYIAFARVLIAQGRYDETIRMLERLLGPAEAGSHTARTIEILLLQALAHQAEGEPARAMALLERALTLAEPGGWIRVFVDEGPPMARLLYQAASRGIKPGYASQLLAAFLDSETTPVAPPQISVRPAAGTGISKSKIHPSEILEPLSERELEVLALIAEGLTNPEIADRLYLSTNTVKAHTRNIYGKLDVHNRTQAVARAQALGILSSI
jgi:LuxR family maltose regulon positive regulatory protein